MDKKDLSISNDDLADIFGTLNEAPAAGPEPIKQAVPKPPAKAEFEYKLPEIEKKPELPKKPAFAEASAGKPAEPEVKSKLIMDRAQEAFRVQESAFAKASADKQQPVDDLVRRAQELEKEMADAKEAELKFADFIDERTINDIVHAFNDLKAEFSKELAGKIDQRSIDNMMVRSIDKAALTFMLLKNTSWGTEDEMKQDGSICAERLIKNMSAFKESIKEIDKEVEESLKALMVMRLVAVKKGLGVDKYAQIKSGLLRRSAVLEGGYRKAVSRFIKSNILENSIKKADESQ